jgi:hypothetical protein
MPEKPKARKMMVVEEVAAEEHPEAEKKAVEIAAEPRILEDSVKDTVSIEPESENQIAVTKEGTIPDKAGELHEKKKHSSLALWIIFPGIFLLGAIVGGIVFYQKGVNQNQVTPTPEATFMPVATPTASPSSTPSATSNLSKYKISIYNGSGIAGEAGKAKTLLTTAGYTVGSTANAATYDYTKTIIKAKSTVDASFISSLSTALGKSYIVDVPQTLATSSADTVQVVIGSSKAQ